MDYATARRDPRVICLRALTRRHGRGHGVDAGHGRGVTDAGVVWVPEHDVVMDWTLTTSRSPTVEYYAPTAHLSCPLP